VLSYAISLARQHYTAKLSSTLAMYGAFRIPGARIASVR
jgi:hypothetical protein